MLEKLLTSPLTREDQDPAEHGGSAGGLRRPGCLSTAVPRANPERFPVG